MARKRAPKYAGELAQRIYLDRDEITVDQVMERAVGKIDLLFKHYKVDPHDKDCWERLAFGLAFAHVPGLQVSMRLGGRERTWKAGQGDELVRAVEDVKSRTGKRTNAAIVELQRDNPMWGNYTVPNLCTRYREAKRFQEQLEAWPRPLKALAVRRVQQLMEAWLAPPPLARSPEMTSRPTKISVRAKTSRRE